MLDCIDLGRSREVLRSAIERPTITQAALLDSLYQLTSDAYPWVGARYADWQDICLLTYQQYFQAARALREVGLIQTQRRHEIGSTVPIVYHALNKPTTPGLEPSLNANVYRKWDQT